MASRLIKYIAIISLIYSCGISMGSGKDPTQNHVPRLGNDFYPLVGGFMYSPMFLMDGEEVVDTAYIIGKDSMDLAIKVIKMRAERIEKLTEKAIE